MSHKYEVFVGKRYTDIDYTDYPNTVSFDVVDPSVIIEADQAVVEKSGALIFMKYDSGGNNLMPFKCIAHGQWRGYEVVHD